ncbi:YggS family pyridoxal phosphate-dependent enzyme [Sulfoacidibacillus thermotolerans]|uniref:YggS family pyridoxal phosphate-dependent enzyme n=1 Tax=Sulfoacidibacillus thermotolerans TaxID=1765684 RepID=UPI0015E82156|nr:YggS family pyridoxal phosphate-dependent enzyme [Sulfoacidibacillus thermotolerans]
MSLNDEQERVDRLNERLAQIRTRIANARKIAHREDDNIRIVAVTKYVEQDVVQLLIRAGLVDFGENRWQVAKPKVESVPSATWHFIGPLQRNKVRMVVPYFSWIHSVDRNELADDINRIASERGLLRNILLQVNVSQEEQKSGVDPEQLKPLLEHCAKLSHVQVVGLMAIGKQNAGVAEARAEFRQLKALRDEVQQQVGILLPELSMGMSNDFDIAVEEGATIVRIGRYLVNFDQDL